jgi:hypothetical protein
MSSKRTVRLPEWEAGPTIADLAAIDAEWSEIEVRRTRRAARVALRTVSTSAGSDAAARGGEAA